MKITALNDYKLDLLQRAMPADHAIVFGDMWGIDGGYTKKCLDYGCKRALLIDTFETPRWLDLRKENPTLDFYKGDFSNTFFMKSFNEQFDVGVVFDILLHQAPLLNTIHLMLEKVKQRFVIYQPMLREQELNNSLVYLPGNRDAQRLYPLPAEDPDHLMFDVYQVNTSHWLWAMTRSFLSSVLKGEGFEITYEKEYAEGAKPDWFWWGCIAERRDVNPYHWSLGSGLRDLYVTEW